MKLLAIGNSLAENPAVFSPAESDHLVMMCHVNNNYSRQKIIDVLDSKGSFHGLELVISVYYMY